VRFWAHDSALEISCSLDTAALFQLDPGTLANEAGLLKTFDLNRAAIEKAATRAYTRDRRGMCTLMASDFV
jgi:hypothetical protein